jgi:hypothetical protein
LFAELPAPWVDQFSVKLKFSGRDEILAGDGIKPNGKARRDFAVAHPTFKLLVQDALDVARTL